MAFYSNKVVWITGASSGIGEALAHALAREGCRLVLSARREAELVRVKQALPVPTENVCILPLDITHIEAFPEAIHTVLQTFGRLDILIQNAGISQRGSALESPLAIDRRLMEVNYFGVIALTKAVLPHFIQQRTGLIVPICSLAGYVATPERTAYAASKFALRGFFDALRAEIWKEGIWVTLVCPGYVRTSLSLNALNSSGKAHNQLDSHSSKGLSAESCAKAIVKALKKGKKEVWIGGFTEVMGAYLKRYVPGLLWLFIRNYRRI
ncbi:SDR family oxidoreductase [Siphonobacter sp. SORGH_AS_0500]|uniref:SDR family oxidoreductase n=1 Tax=Siphonobacter sp. SORGH_AS_0500 TaxID=1864824 RepID=UPI00285B1693|nr:SDR family oxidoreductase [Siphonobacter sp. SORGH_AS_0500]MDR6193380.1 short-subunit dehydrogenase [Siphonobacter sp. SORGH_AS_0500]